MLFCDGAMQRDARDADAYAGPESVFERRGSVSGHVVEFLGGSADASGAESDDEIAETDGVFSPAERSEHVV